MAERQCEKDEQLFIENLEAAQTRLYSYVHMLLQDVNDADDVFQQTTLILWRKFAEYDRTRSFFSWACGIARFEALNYIRKQQRRPFLLGEHADALIVDAFGKIGHQEYDDRREALSTCIQKLRESDQLLLREHYAGSVSVRQIAERLKRTPQSIHNSLMRIRLSLLECIRRSVTRERC